jgi:hypothetical protein
MTRKRITLVGLFILLALLLWLGIWRSPHDPGASSAPVMGTTPSTLAQSPTNAAPAPSSTPTVPHSVAQANQAKLRTVVEGVLSSLGTSIAFYGKVVDQHGQPVVDARVGYSALDKWMQPGTGYNGKSDENGFFNITGIKGVTLSVNVQKKGYYFIYGVSNSAFAYGTGPDSYFKSPPTKDNPAVFVLHKMGEAEPLVHLKTRSIRIPKNGSPADWNLAYGKGSPSGQSVLRIEAWTDNEGLDPNLNEPYDWRCRVSVPGGGLVERQGQFAFTAPENGYSETDEVSFKKNDSPWQRRLEKEYFVKLPNGTYGRLKLWFTTGGKHFAEIESYLNPKVGSRNLEFDPEKIAKRSATQ